MEISAASVESLSTISMIQKRQESMATLAHHAPIIVPETSSSAMLKPWKWSTEAGEEMVPKVTTYRRRQKSFVIH
jgi:hypothetical protein